MEIIHLKTKKYIYFSLVIILATSCGTNKNEETLPNAVLDKKTFATVLTRFLIAESATNLNIKNADITKFDSVYAFNPLKENNITKAQYNLTLAFYAKYPKLYKEVYDDALQQLSELQTQKRAVTVADSINKIKKDTLLKNAK